MTELPESFMNLHRMHRLYILISIQHAISRNVQVDIPIVADAKEAIDEDDGVCRAECETKKWLEQIEELERGTSADNETARPIMSTSGYY